MKKIGVLAGNWRQFDEYKNKQTKTVRDRLVYVYDMDQVRAFEFSECKIVGTFGSRPDAQLLLTSIKPRIR